MPNLDTLEIISKEFGISIDDLLGIERNKICQCCTYPLKKIEELATNNNGTVNTDYCIYCYKNGEWVDPNLTVQGVVEYTIPFMTSPSMNEEKARKYLNDLVPTLKRWKQV